MSRLVELSLAAAVISGAWFGCGSYALAAPASPAWGVDAGAPADAGMAIASTLPGRPRSRAAETAVGRRAFWPSLSSPAVSAATGQISGKVTSAMTAAPLGGIEVCAFVGEELLLPRCVTTGSGGEYTISGLESGSYIVEFNGAHEAKLNYARQYYDGTTSERNADAVPVGSGSVSGINAALAPGGEITGTVKNAKGSLLGNIEVCALDGEEFVERCATTDAQGEYTIVGVAAGGHDVEFATAFEGGGNYVPQYYDGQESLSKATAVTVSAEATTSGIDAVLSPGGQITGTVTSFATHLGLPEVEVCAFVIGGPVSGCTATEPTGAYDLSSLATGQYEVLFLAFGGEYATQYYDEASSAAHATEVAVTAGETRVGINAALRGPVPADVTVPTISGSPVDGQTLTVTHGSWTHAPTSYRDEWGRCANSEIESCHTVAMGQSYTLSASDLGYELRVRESASNENGGEQFAISAPTATVTGPTGTHSGGLVDSVPPPPAFTPVSPPAGRVAGYQESIPVPDAKLASTALEASASGAVAVKVSCPTGVSSCSGAVTLRTLNAVSTSSGRAGHSKKAILTLASGSFTVAGGRVKTVTLHLSEKGRALLSRSHELRVRTTIVAHDPAGTAHTTQTVATLRASKSTHGKG